MSFLFAKLSKQKTELSSKFVTNIEIQLEKRRSCPLLSTIKFLRNPAISFSRNDEEYFEMATKTVVFKTAQAFYKRLFEINEQAPVDDVINSQVLVADHDVFDVADSSDEDMEKQLTKYINRGSNTSTAVVNNTNSFKNDLNVLKNSGQQSPNIKRLIAALNTIKPTSTQNERNFSTSGNTVSLKRSRLSDKSIDCLCFLKYHFNKNIDN